MGSDILGNTEGWISGFLRMSHQFSLLNPGINFSIPPAPPEEKKKKNKEKLNDEYKFEGQRNEGKGHFTWRQQNSYEGKTCAIQKTQSPPI